MPTPYTVWHAMEWESLIEGGVKVSAQQQRSALDRAGVSYATEAPGDYDLLHLNFPGPLSLARLLRAKRAGKPVVCHAHSVGENIAGTYRFSGVLEPAINRYFSRFYDEADVVIAVSEYMRDRLRANGVGGDVEVVSNGVDGAALDGFEDLDVAGQWDTDPDGFTAVNLAQVFELKGVPEFVAAGEALPDVEFRWFGPKHKYIAPSDTKRTVENAPPNVRFPGFVDDKRAAFALGDAFFFPTRRDNQPLAILEALYCGMPIVTRDIPAFEGWLTHERNCLKADSVDGFVTQLERLRDDDALRERLSQTAREDAREHTLDAVGERLRDVYEGLLA